MRHLFSHVIVSIALLFGCSTPPEVTATPAPDHVLPLLPSPQASGACPDGSSTWSPDASLLQLPGPVDLTACFAAGWSQVQVVDCVQAALDGAPASQCIAAGCCLDSDAWVARLDHGMGMAQTTAQPARRLFWLQLRRRFPGELPSVWRVYGLGGFADLPATVAATVGDLHPPDCGEDPGPCFSRYWQTPMFGPRIGTVDVLIVGWIDARFR